MTTELFLLILSRLVEALREFENAKREITSYNRADTVNMSPNEMNHFRHIAASAYLIKRGFSEFEVELLGNMKEIGDFCRKFTWSDADFDKQNNKKGIRIGKQHRYAGQKDIFDFIFKTEIEPLRKRF